MDDGSRQPVDDVLATALKELDAAKASMRKMQGELSDAIGELAHMGCSRECSQNFEATARAMNEATERHRRAVKAFNAACQPNHNHAISEFDTGPLTFSGGLAQIPG